MRKAIEGQDYLVDYYAVLEVPRFADALTVNKSFHRLLRDHPDRVDNKGKEIKSLASSLTLFRTKARDILIDPVKRPVYDEALRTWRGRISTSPEEMVIIDGVSATDFVKLTLPEEQKRMHDFLDLFKTSSGHDEDIFSYVKEQWEATERPSEKLRKAYDRVLAAKAVSLGGEVIVLGAYVGIDADKAVEDSEAVRLQLETSATEIRTAIENGSFQVPALTSGETSKKGAESSTVPEVGLTLFHQTAAQVLDISNAREEVISERMAIFRGTYVVTANEGRVSEKLVVLLMARSGVRPFGFQLTGNKVNTIDDEVFEVGTDSDLQALKLRGFDVIRFEPDLELSVLEQRDVLLNDHYGRVLNHGAEPQELNDQAKGFGR